MSVSNKKIFNKFMIIFTAFMFCLIISCYILYQYLNNNYLYKIFLISCAVQVLNLLYLSVLTLDKISFFNMGLPGIFALLSLIKIYYYKFDKQTFVAYCIAFVVLIAIFAVCIFLTHYCKISDLICIAIINLVAWFIYSKYIKDYNNQQKAMFCRTNAPQIYDKLPILMITIFGVGCAFIIGFMIYLYIKNKPYNIVYNIILSSLFIIFASICFMFNDNNCNDDMDERKNIVSLIPYFGFFTVAIYSIANGRYIIGIFLSLIASNTMLNIFANNGILKFCTTICERYDFTNWLLFVCACIGAFIFRNKKNNNDNTIIDNNLNGEK